MGKKYEDMPEEEPERDERREARRKRRIRNQIISWLVLVVFLGAVVYGGYTGIRSLLYYLNNRPQPVTERVTEVSGNETVSADESAGIISTPDIEDDYVQEVTEQAAADENADIKAAIASMSLEQKAANLFIVTPEAITGVAQVTKAGDGTKAALQQYAVGGLLYRSQNVTSAEQFKEMVQTTKDMYKGLYNSNVWTVVEEDGTDPVIEGAKTGTNVVDTASAIGESGDSGNAYTAYVNIAAALKEYSIDMNLGPVCDVKAESSTFLGDASFSSDADIAASMVRQAVNAQKEGGILTCLTSFPGLGSADADPAAGAAKTEKSTDDLKAQDFLPFEAGIEEGADVLMVSNITAPELTGDEVPCSMSSTVINDIIRDELGFQGLIITDHMNQKAITTKFNSGEAAVMAIKAGADMILEPEDFTAAYQAVIDAVNDGSLEEDRIDEALLHIYILKNAQ